MYELEIIAESFDLAVKNSWNQTRYIAYSVLQSQSSKQLELKDIIKFSWDNDTEEKEYIMTNEDIQRMKKKAEKIISNEKK